MNNNSSKLINLTPGNTFLHKLTGRSKVALFLALVVAVTMSFDFPIIFPLLVVSTIGLISLKPNWKTIIPIMTVVVLMNAFNIFLYWVANPNAGEFYNHDSTVLYALSDYFIFTKGSMWYFFVRFLKMITSFMICLVFIISITPSELAAGLSRIGLPYKFGSIVEIAFRYIPDISRDYENISVSMQCRGLELDKKKEKPLVRLKQMVLILIPLVITSFDRVNNISNAMDLRGFGKLKKRSYYAEHEESIWDKIALILTALVIVGIVVYVVYNIVVPRTLEMWIFW